ncbi:hypothetical protein OHT61_31960 [Streptomyces sp. NBC_00178]|uniref:hypothetical protein n=1 Tax=Streptomyces sp. NBC_00178 TaxID=2975672 RepID=UPI002E2C2FDB|nr:hypothetical protein [Streptomyces sp. NBC_00178]
MPGTLGTRTDTRTAWAVRSPLKGVPVRDIAKKLTIEVGKNTLASRPTIRHHSRSPPASPPATRCSRRGQILSRSQCRACSHHRATTACANANTLSGSAPVRTARRATPTHRRCAATTSGRRRTSRCS